MQGSGKTLAFGLPTLQLLLNDQAAQADHSQPEAAKPEAEAHQSISPNGEAEDMEGIEVGADGGPKGQGKRGIGGKLRALILAPTRELAMQVSWLYTIMIILS